MDMKLNSTPLKKKKKTESFVYLPIFFFINVFYA